MRRFPCMPARRPGGRKKGIAVPVTPPLRAALAVFIQREDVDYDAVKRRTGLTRTTIQRIARGIVKSSAKAAELHKLVGLPPPDRSAESRVLDAFRTIARSDPAHADLIVAELERQAGEIEQAEREEVAAAEAHERARQRRAAAVKRPLPPRAVH